MVIKICAKSRACLGSILVLFHGMSKAPSANKGKQYFGDHSVPSAVWELFTEYSFLLQHDSVPLHKNPAP